MRFDTARASRLREQFRARVEAFAPADLVRMLALGADFVLMGRAWAYALAASGGAGVAHVLQLIDAEMRVAMALTGCKRIDQLNDDILDRGGNQATF